MDDLSWKGSGKRWTLKAAQNLGLMGLMKMNTQQRAELAQFYRNQFILRAEQFARAGRVGYALAKVFKDMEDVNEKLGFHLDPFDPIVERRGKYRVLSDEFSMRKNPQNALASYITIMQDFFKAKSSTIKGWDEIGLAQDKRLFGALVTKVSRYHWKRNADGDYVLDEKGHRIKEWYTEERETPEYRMSDAERIMFWRVYEEVRKTGWNGINDYSSDSQRLFATHWQTGSFNRLDFSEAYKVLSDMLDERPRYMRENAPGISGDPFQQDGEGDINGGYQF